MRKQINANSRDSNAFKTAILNIKVNLSVGKISCKISVEFGIAALSMGLYKVSSEYTLFICYIYFLLLFENFNFGLNTS